MIRQTKTIQISTYNYNLLAESIHSPNFFCQILEMSKFAKLYLCQTFPLYSKTKIAVEICHERGINEANMKKV